jgi:dimethylamine/trimethylamine dehydrogenase
MAELLAADGFDVTIVTSYPVLSPVSDETLEGEMLRAHVHRAGIRVRHARTLTAIEVGSPAAGPVLLTGTDRHGDPWSAECDGVVLVTQQASEDSLFRELAAQGVPAFIVGDAVAPRLISEAVFDGHRLGREIDRPDPGRPAPYLREHAG